MKAEKSKMMFFEERKAEVIDTSYRMNVSAVGRCEIVLGGENMEEMKKFKYFGIVICKHGDRRRNKREREREREREL